MALAACARKEDTKPAQDLNASAPASSSSATGSPVAAANDKPTPEKAAGVAGASPDPAAQKPLNVVLITIDCLRADMPWAGYPRPIAPRLTEFAARAVEYTHAYALSSYTSMSVGGFLSGRLPGELKRDGYFFGTYAKENLFFPELLQDAKVFTAAAHAHGYFKKSGLEQGFDAWEIVPNLKWNNTTDENITSPELEAIAERLLSDPRAELGRLFAWVHFLDPHDKYMPHDGISWGKTQRDRYDGEITYTDRYIGKLLDFIAARPWGPRTAVIITADHGEAFGEHKQYVHGFELWENLVRVPLLVSIPGVAPRKIDTPRSAIDLAPTVLDLFGVPTSPDFLGKSLVPEIRGAAEPTRDILVDLPATSDNDRKRAFLHGNLKVIAAGEADLAQVFDIKEDPGELSPIRGTDATKEIVALYKERQRSIRDVPPTKCKEGCLNGGYRKK
ncbi:sulfatase [Pendulispora albinea]|uniref:Sulfatase n=1 Tax=Pendulispora albinea TaxID=2741071 RepID=A0ABZ2M4A7_9BACT